MNFANLTFRVEHSDGEVYEPSLTSLQTMTFVTICNVHYYMKTVSVAYWGVGGGGHNKRLLKYDRLCFCFIPFCIRMFKNVTQIARESMKKKNTKSYRALKVYLYPGNNFDM